MLKKLSYFWRFFATGFAFTVFGIGGLLLGGLIFPILLLLPNSSDARLRQTRGCVGIAFRLFFLMMHYLGLLRYRVVGRELIKKDKCCLVVANHPSLIDVVSLISLYPNACCVIKKDLWRNPFMGRVLRAAGYIPNDDPEVFLEGCKQSLDRGDALIIFPEGTRSVPGKEMTLQRGAAHIALRLNCPIRTIQIRVNPSTLTKNMSWRSIADRRVDFMVTINRLIGPEEFEGSSVPRSLASRRLTKKIRANIDIGLVQTT